MAVSVVPQNCVIDLRCSTPADSTKYLHYGPQFYHEQMEYNECYFDEVGVVYCAEPCTCAKHVLFFLWLRNMCLHFCENKSGFRIEIFMDRNLVAI
jgi:hypothetical protein